MFKILTFLLLYMTASYNLINTSFASITSAKSCTVSDVQFAINSASPGDTVNVPAGECSWKSGVSVSGINLIGAGKEVGGTVITMNYFEMFSITSHSTKQTRVEGFRFTYSSPPSGGDYVIDLNNGHNGLSDAPVVIGDIYIEYTGGGIHKRSFARLNCARGVMYEVDFINVGQEVVYATCSPNYEWTTNPGPVNFGSDEFFFIEDCTWTHTSFISASHAIMGDAGGKYVARYNTVNGGMNIDAHGYCGGSLRDCGIRAAEIYKNTYNMNISGSATNMINFRGGPGYIWGNELYVTAGSQNRFAQFMEYQLAPGSICPYQGCCTTDPCAQQIAYDLKVGADSNDYADYTAFVQRPIYMWDNDVKQGSLALSPGVVYISTALGGCVGTSANVQEGDDIFAEDSGYVSTGLDADKPGTCKDDYGYWATDTETLYVCDSNSWVLDYQPYTYPHPLRILSDNPDPLRILSDNPDSYIAPPKNLRISNQ